MVHVDLGEVVGVPFPPGSEQLFDPGSQERHGGPDLREGVGGLPRNRDVIGSGKYGALLILELDNPSLAARDDSELAVTVEPMVWRQALEHAVRGHAAPFADLRQ